MIKKNKKKNTYIHKSSLPFFFTRNYYKEMNEKYIKKMIKK